MYFYLKSQDLFPINIRSRTAELEKASFLINEKFLIKDFKRSHGDTGYKGRMLGRSRLETGNGASETRESVAES